MKKFKALIITGVIAGIILVFASGFWMGVLGILKAIVWPAFLVFKLFGA